LISRFDAVLSTYTVYGGFGDAEALFKFADWSVLGQRRGHLSGLGMLANGAASAHSRPIMSREIGESYGEGPETRTATIQPGNLYQYGLSNQNGRSVFVR